MNSSNNIYPCDQILIHLFVLWLLEHMKQLNKSFVLVIHSVMLFDDFFFSQIGFFPVLLFTC